MLLENKILEINKFLSKELIFLLKFSINSLIKSFTNYLLNLYQNYWLNVVKSCIINGNVISHKLLKILKLNGFYLLVQIKD